MSTVTVVLIGEKNLNIIAHSWVSLLAPKNNRAGCYFLTYYSPVTFNVMLMRNPALNLGSQFPEC